MSTEETIKMYHKVEKHLELEDLIENKDDVDYFLRKNKSGFQAIDKQDSFASLRKMLTDWVEHQDDKYKKVFVFYKDPDDFARNDSYGGYELHRCIIVTFMGQDCVLSEVVRSF